MAGNALTHLFLDMTSFAMAFSDRLCGKRRLIEECWLHISKCITNPFVPGFESVECEAKPKTDTSSARSYDKNQYFNIRFCAFLFADLCSFLLFKCYDTICLLHPDQRALRFAFWRKSLFITLTPTWEDHYANLVAFLRDMRRFVSSHNIFTAKQLTDEKRLPLGACWWLCCVVTHDKLVFSCRREANWHLIVQYKIMTTPPYLENAAHVFRCNLCEIRHHVRGA